MKKVEFLGRFAVKKKKSKEDEYDEYVQSLLPPGVHSEQEPEKEYDYAYDPITLDLDQIEEYIRMDISHTQLNMESGRMFIVKIPYQNFSELYQQLTGSFVTKIVFNEEPEPKRRRSKGMMGDTADFPKLEFGSTPETDEEK